MPYRWTSPPNDGDILALWPHQSLTPRGMAAFILVTFFMISLPLLSVLGTPVLWGLLPFLLLAVGGIWFALERSYQDRSILETLTIRQDSVSLTRTMPKQQRLSWECNLYWAKAHLHQAGGPVPNYVTLSGNGREVEIGAFLSEEERLSLYTDLAARLS